MFRQSFFTKKHYRVVAWAAVAVSAVFLIVNLFVIGGDAFVIGLSDFLPIPLSIFTTLLAILLWLKFAPRSPGRKLWSFFFAGWGAWAIGEILYVVFAAFSDEVPYPSLADIFYVAGSIALIAGLYSNILKTPDKLSPQKSALLAALYLLIITIPAILVIWPLIQNSDPSQLMATILDVTYAVLDILLLLRGVRLLVDYGAGSRSHGWLLLIIGFMLVTFADLGYSYTNSFGIYYPDDRVNLITTLMFAFPYNLAYIFWMLGIYRLQIKQDEMVESDQTEQPGAVDNTHIVLFLNQSLEVDESSSNVQLLYPSALPDRVHFAGLLGLSNDEKLAIQTELHQKAKLTDFPINLRTTQNEKVDAKICALSIYDPQRNFIGALLVLRFQSSHFDNDSRLTEYHLSILRNVKNKSGSTEDQSISSFLRTYFQPYFNHIEDIVYKHGGSQQGLIFIDVFNQWASDNNWDIHIKDHSLIVSEKYTPGELLKGLSALLQFTRGHIESMAEPAEVEKEISTVTARFDPSVNETFQYIKTVLATKE